MEKLRKSCGNLRENDKGWLKLINVYQHYPANVYKCCPKIIPDDHKLTLNVL